MSKICQECGAKCCKYFCFEIDEPDDCEEFEDIRWYLCHEGVTVHIDEGDWYISIENRCKYLGPDNLCTIYENRPLICHNYDTSQCDYTSGDYGYDELFTTPEELEAYARRVLGKEAFDDERAKLRAKLNRKASKHQEKRESSVGNGRGDHRPTQKRVATTQ